MQRFCVINCENSAAWKPIDFAEMFQQTLAQPNDVWTRCNVAMDEELPSDILTYQGLVITGSHFNCRDRERLPWFDKVCDIIRNASINAQPRIYGGCFGCQIIAFALGGVVDRNPQEKFVLRAERIVWSYNAEGNCNCSGFCSYKQIQQLSLSTNQGCCGSDSLTTNTLEAKGCDCGATCTCGSSCCSKPSSEDACNCGASCQCSTVTELPLPVEFIEAFKTRGLILLESHGDCVCCLPPGAVLLGDSCSCCSELFLAVQSLTSWHVKVIPSLTCNMQLKKEYGQQ
jgi:GMP synthase-like glutamine amidotransferase